MSVSAFKATLFSTKREIVCMSLFMKKCKRELLLYCIFYTVDKPGMCNLTLVNYTSIQTQVMSSGLVAKWLNGNAYTK